MEIAAGGIFTRDGTGLVARGDTTAAATVTATGTITTLGAGLWPGSLPTEEERGIWLSVGESYALN